MKPSIRFVFLAAIILVFSGVMLIALPYLQLSQAPEEKELSPYTERELLGRQIYVSEGCVYCHSQQPRDPSQSEADQAWGWGRPSTPGDYAYDYPHQLGTMRTGPDLFNIGARQPSEEWHLTHLYQPRAVSPGSVMPAYPYFFESKAQAEEGDVVVSLPPEYATDGEVVVAKEEALLLVEYLKSLDHTYPTDALPQPEKKEEVGQ